MTWGAEERLLARAVRHGLPDSPDIAEPPPRIDDANRLLARALTDHLLGFLMLAHLDDVVHLDDDIAERATAQWHRELVGCVLLEAAAVGMAEALDDAGARWAISKGPAFAHLDYPDPSMRPFGDIDLVIHPDDWDLTVKTLVGVGFTRPARELPAHYDYHFGKGATLVREGIEADLHLRFAIGRFGITSQMRDLFGDLSSFRLGQRDIPALGPSGRLLHACFHSQLGGFQFLRAHRDVAQMVLGRPGLWVDAVRIAVAWDATAVVARSIVRTWTVFDLDMAHPAVRWARSTSISALDERALAIFEREAPFRTQALTAIPVLRLGSLPRYLWALAAPH